MLALQLPFADCAIKYTIVTGPLSPLQAADVLIHTRETIVNVANKHRLRATFAPRVFTAASDCEWTPYLPSTSTYHIHFEQGAAAAWPAFLSIAPIQIQTKSSLPPRRPRTAKAAASRGGRPPSLPVSSSTFAGSNASLSQLRSPTNGCATTCGDAVAGFRTAHTIPKRPSACVMVLMGRFSLS